MRRPNGYWNLQTLTESAKEFDTISSWSKADMGAYLAARRLGLINQVTSHMLTHAQSISKARRVWTKEACMASAAQYLKRYDWEKSDSPAYQAAKHHGWYEDCVSHMQLGKARNGFWNLETCLIEADKHSTISAWAKANGASYQAALANPDWFAQCISHMKRLWVKKWSENEIIVDARKYSTIQEWSRSSGGYGAAIKRGLVKQATEHMDKNPRWFGVATIHRILQAYDIDYVAEQTFDDCRDKRKLPFDFYLPTINLLIEHHGVQHLRGWQGRGVDDIQRRDDIKRQYAAFNGIAFLEIKEWEVEDPTEIEKLIVAAIKKSKPDSNLVKRELTEFEIAKSRVKQKFDFEEIKTIAAQYNTRVGFKRGNEAAYNFAYRYGFIDLVCTHMISKSEAQSRRLTKWTKDKVIESAEKFRTSREWASREGSAYNAARKNGWIDEACQHMPSRKK